MALPFFRYRTPDRWLWFYDMVSKEVAQLPAARAASFVCCDVPLDRYSIGQSFEVVGERSIDPAHQPLAHFQLAGPRYFETMGMSILRGRAFTERDTEATGPVCIVNVGVVGRNDLRRHEFTSTVDVQIRFHRKRRRHRG